MSPRAATPAFERWMVESIAPIANGLKLRGKGPLFRRRDGGTWIVFAIERRPIDPAGATAAPDDGRTDFRFVVGLDIPRMRPTDPDPDRAPTVDDVTSRSPSLALQPPGGAEWFTFEPTDIEGQQGLTELVARGLPDALRELARAEVRAELEHDLASAGPLENLSPGHAEQLLALADEAGATDIRRQIADALRRDPVPDPTRPTPEDWLRETQELFPGLVVEQLPMPRDDELDRPWRPRRRTEKQRERLLADLASDRTFPRRQAALALGGWDGEPEIVEALHAARQHPDGFTAAAALTSLAQLGDADPLTWSLGLALIPLAGEGPGYVAQAIVLLALLDPDHRAPDAHRALDELVDRYPAWTRRILGLKTHLPPSS